jgi:hypothetical protein
VIAATRIARPSAETAPGAIACAPPVGGIATARKAVSIIAITSARTAPA